LSSNTAGSGSVIEGFLYVPTLADNGACTTGYVPANVTHRAQLPSSSVYAQLAFAPWIDSDCTLQYLAQANSDAANAVIFYHTTGMNTTNYGSGSPPPPTDPSWDLGDGGAWKNKYGFPVYAINSHEGNTTMTQLSLVSCSGTVFTTFANHCL